MRKIPLLLLPVLAVACATAPSDGDQDVAGSSAIETGGARDPDTQMRAIVATARTAAANRRPGGHCYAAVARYIDTVGYGNMPAQPKGSIGTLPSIPPSFTAEAHMFADFANAPGNAATLGLVRLSLDNPYDAPAGAIVVVRAGTPGTAHPTAGDITIAAGDGVFYNDGKMAYGGAERFPPGNDFVLGVYVPAGAGADAGNERAADQTTCTTDAECSGGRTETKRVCGASAHVCIDGCHRPSDCPPHTACTRLADGRQLCQ